MRWHCVLLAVCLVALQVVPGWGQTGLVFTEIMYDPDSPEPDWEWIQLCNRSHVPIVIDGWIFDDDNGTELTAANISTFNSVGPRYCIMLYNADAISYGDFEDAWAPWGGFNGVAVSEWPGLSNSGETISLWATWADYEGDHEYHNNAVLSLTYHDGAPWPLSDGKASIQLKAEGLDPADGDNWDLSAVGDNLGSYQSIATTTNTGLDVGSPDDFVFSSEIFADGFEEGHTAYWSDSVSLVP